MGRIWWATLLVWLTVIAWPGRAMAQENGTQGEGDVYRAKLLEYRLGNYKGLSILGHMLAISSTILFIPPPLLYYQHVYGYRDVCPAYTDECHEDPRAYKFLPASIAVATLAMSFYIIGVPLLIAARHKARNAMDAVTKTTSVRLGQSRSLSTAAWVFYPITMLLLPVEMLLVFQKGTRIPICSIFAMITVALAEGAWAHAHIAVREARAELEAGEEMNDISVSVTPWILPMPEGIAAGVGMMF